MPQEVPLEASKTLAFTPECLEALVPKPVFIMRTATWREKEQRFYLHRLVGAVSHTEEAQRDEVRAGLAAQWTADQCEEMLPVINAYWDALDQFEAQKRDDPELEWSYDSDIERGIIELVSKMERNWPPLARMAADTAKYNRFQPIIYLAIMVERWEGIDLKRELDDGYIKIDCAYAMQEKLFDLERLAGAKPGRAIAQLQVECMRRMHLGEDFAKNSESPSPSEMTPPASTPTKTSDADGKSQGSTARSKKTRGDA